MDIKYVNNDFQFIYRVSSIIYNNAKTKILLFYGNDRDFYMLPGGKVHELEDSLSAIKREIKEELDYNNLNFRLISISEEFAKAKGYNNHQINLIYECIYSGKITNESFKSKESDWINFKWVNINEIDKLNIYPKDINKIINSNNIVHLISNNLK